VYGQRPLAPGVAVARQKPDQITMITAGEDGAVYVGWEAAGGPWHTPVRISGPGLVPVGTSFAMQWESQEYGKLDAFFVGYDGRVYVTSDVDGQAWTAPQGLGPTGLAPAGAPIATGWTRPGAAGATLNAFVVDNNGRLNVFAKPPGGPWAGPTPISPVCTP